MDCILGFVDVCFGPAQLTTYSFMRTSAIVVCLFLMRTSIDCRQESHDYLNADLVTSLVIVPLAMNV